MSRAAAALAALGVAAALLAGCASVPPVPPAAETPAELSRWSGRFSVTVTDPAAQPREDRASGSFALESLAGSTVLDLATPLGQTMARASLTPAGASLVTAEGRRYEASSPEELTELAFGWRVPIGDLPQWLRGRIPSPTEHEAGRAVAGRERGWAIRVEAWDGDRPRRLSLDWPADAPSGARRLNLKLLIDAAS